jgi:succinate dehydrogenase / fumarate reductase membrane anchor subunit
VTNDYVTHNGVRRTLIWAIWLVAAFLILLGTLVVFTFDPCPAGAAANLLPDFCSAS